jgi:general secretion pathway protein H
VFWQFGDDAYWAEIRDDESLRARTLPQGMTLSALRIENHRPPEHMRLEFNPYSTTLSFSVDMAFGAEHCTVTGSPVGEVRVLPEQVKRNG